VCVFIFKVQGLLSQLYICTRVTLDSCKHFACTCST